MSLRMDNLQRWRAEKAAAYLQRSIAAREPDPRLRALFEQLSVATEKQADIIAKDLPPAHLHFAPSIRVRLIARAVGLLGPRRARPLLAAAKVRGLSAYDGALRRSGHSGPGAVDVAGRGHRGTGGGVIRAAVFGVNDGLVSNTSLIMGMAGAAASSEVLLLAGVAGLLAGAFSMAAGEYISVRTQREMFERQIEQERDELARYPEEEAEELALIYHARGLPLDAARAFAKLLAEDPDVALEAHARDELGLNPNDLGSPAGAALYSFLSFSIGALTPLLPFLFAEGHAALVASAALAALALFGVGATMSLFSGRSALAGGFRMLLIGAAAAGATFAIGALLGVSVS